MSYQVHITRAAERDLNSAADYIDFVLKNPTAADHLLDLAEAKINELADFPEKFSLADDPVLAAWGIRFVVVNHYLAFYVIDKPAKIVHVIRFLYGKSNWQAILKADFSAQ